MDAVEISVVVGSAALIALVLWFFFGAREAPTAAVQAGERGAASDRAGARKSEAQDSKV